MSQITYAQGVPKPKVKRAALQFIGVDYWVLACSLVALAAFGALPWVEPGSTGLSTLVGGQAPWTLILIPLAGASGIALTVWGAASLRHRRITALLTLSMAAFAFAYYYTLFLADDQRPFNTTITAGVGFWAAFLALIGLAVQVYFRRPARKGAILGESLWRNIGVTLSALLLFLLFWEMVIVTYRVPRYIIPRPSAILQQYFDVRIRSAILMHTGVTAVETLVGFFVAVSLGVPLAMFVAFTPFLNKTIYPAAVALEMVPKIAFAPLFVTWFGFGFAPKIIVVFMVCFFPIMLNGVLAFRSLAPDVIYFAQSTGASNWRMFWKIRLPAALPQIFNGLKGAATNATVGAVIAEWIGADQGLGVYLQSVQSQLRTDVGFAIIFVLAAMGLALFYAVALAEKILIPWHVSQRVGGQVNQH